MADGIKKADQKNGEYVPVSFCWACGRKLWNKNRPTVRIIDGHPRTLHKFCAKHIDWMSQVKD